MTTQRLTRAESKARTRRRLLMTAARLFRQSGVTDTTLESIADEAGLTRGAIYAHFKDKNDLVAALLHSAGAVDARQFADFLDASKPLAQRMAAFEEEYMKLFGTDEKQGALHAELIAYALRDRAIRTEAAAVYRRSDEALAEGLDTQPGRGLTKKEVIAVLHAVRDGIAMHRLIDPESYPDDAVREALLAVGQLLLDDR